jgi:hypothetical protein
MQWSGVGKTAAIISDRWARSPRVSVHDLKAVAWKHWQQWLPEKVATRQAGGKLSEAPHGAANGSPGEVMI